MELVFYGVLTVVIVLLVARQYKAGSKEGKGASSALYLARDNSEQKKPVNKPKLRLVATQGNTARNLNLSEPKTKPTQLKLVHSQSEQKTSDK
ncbi:hypothetical protein [Vibrio sp. SCSIO 43136]|uniref:hypothetical protein n=1 Tax=Vibrio sp. SCSIO 43136 TaxID=2819101 RepID=UPI0020765FE1|nr:hypothetical protein [Vibrio sp. SCSIO 43136]USD63964.1 hypothetical protein J4N39_07435 [Vibrio sp. SCSIO 43136]